MGNTWKTLRGNTKTCYNNIGTRLEIKNRKNIGMIGSGEFCQKDALFFVLGNIGFFALETLHFTMDWFKGKSTGKPHI